MHFNNFFLCSNNINNLYMHMTYRPKMSEQERRKIVTRMDMSPISMEYETELK